MAPAQQNDVDLATALPEAVGYLVVHKLSSQGFCVLNGFNAAVATNALEDVQRLEALNRFKRPHPIIREGLLGDEGSVTIAELGSPGDDKDALREDETLRELDYIITDIGLKMEAHLAKIGINTTLRSLALVHKSGEVLDDGKKLSEKEVSKWLTQFVRHRVMVLCFLGPDEGRLELCPYEPADAISHQVCTFPGMIVVLRPDLLKYSHAPLDGSAVVMTSFFLEGLSKKDLDVETLVPAARELDEWILSRLEDIKATETDERDWDPEIPLEWQKVMNHLYHRGQMIAVCGVACRFPCTEEVKQWFQASSLGPDYVSEVPATRWDHDEIYDPDPESWREGKSYCRHAAFMEGVELFDHQVFNISQSEARCMDPNQRHVLEVGYTALHSMGLRRRTLTNLACGVYIGNGACEWNHLPRQKDYGAFGAVGTALAISAGRFSFCFGLKGPSMTLDTEGSSGLTALYMAAEAVQRKGTAQACDLAIATAVHLCLASVWWPTHCASGWLSRGGRCFTFDASASGYVRGEGCASVVVKPMCKMANGELVEIEDDPSTIIGCIAGASMNTNGAGASLSAPHGPSEQEAIYEALRNASVAPYSVDGVECHGSGALLADAVEVGSMLRSHRDMLENNAPFALHALKTSTGNQVECGGIASFLRAVFAARWGTTTPSLHLRVANPHIYAFAEPMLLPSEALELPADSVYTGVMSRGFGGSNVYMLAWAELGDERPSVASPVEKNKSKQCKDQRGDALRFWPGGGGELLDEQLPAEGYYIVGTWNGWRDPLLMEDEGQGIFGYTVTLGESRWERFQIWLDGDSHRVLHPGRVMSSRNATVLGPESDVPPVASNWMIDGRTELLGFVDRGGYADEAHRIKNGTNSDDIISKVPRGSCGTNFELLPVGTADAGLLGDRYRVRLRVAGRWRSVDWQKLPTSVVDSSLGSAWSVPALTGSQHFGDMGPTRYCIYASWNDWAVEDMVYTSTVKGSRYHAEVLLTRADSDFQLLRDGDVGQALYPACHGTTVTAADVQRDEVPVLGPDDASSGRCWRLEGTVPGDVVSIELELTVDPTRLHISKQLTWRRLRREKLGNAKVLP
eukprot:TRINITY_DN33257_c0_g1_i1.p1 TRINITY_DN33257_c0_g1~~TRINITY_DN33257_c0_g1_i1.p1  ORF type:complete len:1086 (+),score=166.97 TRINITY_DN33257_c0_g1_i1:241-3498(+)